MAEVKRLYVFILYVVKDVCCWAWWKWKNCMLYPLRSKGRVLDVFLWIERKRVNIVADCYCGCVEYRYGKGMVRVWYA